MNKKSSASKKPSIAIELLMADHRTVEQLFEAFEDQEGDDSRRETALRICKELTVHATVEEELFYPWVRGNIEETDLVAEAEVEHQSAKELIAQIEAAEDLDEKFDAKVTVLKEYIEHHVEEEEGEMFPKLAGFKDELDELGQEMTARKVVLAEELGLMDDEEDVKAGASRAKDPAGRSAADSAGATGRGGRRAGR